MLHDEFSESVNSTPERAYSFFIRRSGMIQWLDRDSMQYEFGFKDLVAWGDRVRITPKKGGIGWRIDAECSDLLPDERIVWRFVDGPLRGTETWAVDRTKDGCTVRKSLDYEVKGLSKRLAWAFVARRAHSRTCRQEMDRLRKILEKPELSA